MESNEIVFPTIEILPPAISTFCFPANCVVTEAVVAKAERSILSVLTSPFVTTDNGADACTSRTPETFPSKVSTFCMTPLLSRTRSTSNEP